MFWRCLLVVAVALSACRSLRSATPPTLRTYIVPAEIPADCSTDVTLAINAWIAAAPDGSTLRFSTNACYNVDGGLAITDRNGITVDGNGATFRIYSHDRLRHGISRSIWLIQGGSRITLRNMIVKGQHSAAGCRDDAWQPKRAFQHAFVFEGVQTATLEFVRASEVYGDFVLARHETRGAFPGVPSRNLTVRKSRFERNGRQGVALTHVDGFNLEDSYLGEINQTAIDIELDEDGSSSQCGAACPLARNIRIERNAFGRVRHSILANAGRGASDAVGTIVFSDNIMLADPYNCAPPIWIYTPREEVKWSGYRFERNYLRTYGNAFDLSRLVDVTVRGNTLVRKPYGGCGRESAVWVKNSSGVQVLDNIVLAAGQTYPLLQLERTQLTVAPGSTPEQPLP